MGESLLVGVGDEVIWTFGVFVVIIGLILTAVHFFPYLMPSVWDSQTDMNPVAAGRAYNSEICPICLDRQKLAVETNCGHNFCGSCISNYVNSRTSLFSGCLSCPLCRQGVNLLLINFSRDDNEVDAAERREVEQTVYEYNVRFGSGPRSWATYIRDCPVLVRHVIADFFSLGGLLWMFRLRVIACFTVAAMYLLVPLDIIPESLFGFFGLLDDLIVIFLCAIYLTIIYRRFLVDRANDADM